MTDYNVQFPDGTPLVIQTGTINNTYDIPLVGQDAINYGDDFATAYIRLLSNFAYTSAPSFGTNRTAGQLWYDTTPSTGGLNIFDGTSWDAVPIDSTVASAPINSLTTNYIDNPIGTDLDNGEVVYLKFYLNVSSAQQVGMYANNVTFRVLAAGYTP